MSRDGPTGFGVEGGDLATAVARDARSFAPAGRVLDELEMLPAPVARYLRRAACPGSPRIRLARLRQVGSLRTSGESDRWMPFEASHVAAPESGAFVWDARVRIAPLVHLRVVDSLFHGRGSTRVSFLSVPILASTDGIEATSGALHRFLAESVWYPSALLPSEKLRWSAIDDHRALATLTESGITVSLEFRFNFFGEVTGVFTPSRWGRFRDGYRQAPWEGHFWSYRPRDGRILPFEGEVGWLQGGEWLPVWKGRIEHIEHELAR